MDAFLSSISAYQLFTFLCDERLESAILPLIPQKMESIRQRQYDELGRGGADLIRLDKNPESIKDFQTFKAFQTTFVTNEGENPLLFPC